MRLPVVLAELTAVLCWWMQVRVVLVDELRNHGKASGTSIGIADRLTSSAANAVVLRAFVRRDDRRELLAEQREAAVGNAEGEVRDSVVDR